LDEIAVLIARATAARAAHAEKSQAFGEIVRRFQDLAFGCAFSYLGDFHLAQDAAQEAFLTAWRSLDQLRLPEAFPGWLKRVVLTQCNRLTRGKRLDTVPLDALVDAPAAGPDPAAAYEQSERQARVLAAIRELPEHERLVTTLYYMADYPQSEIAAFLELPVTTIKKRLFSARQKLRQRTLDMVRETLRERRPSRSEQFAETVALFTAALDSFVAKVKQDRYVIAAILYGSLSHDTVWRKSDIDVVLICRDEPPVKQLCLVENGIDVHAELYPRSKFKQALERSLHGSVTHSSFALSTLLFTRDDTIRAYYQDVQRIGSRDRQLRLLGTAGAALYTLAKAEKWLLTRGDVAYSFLWIMYTIQYLATIEVLLHGELTTREVIPQARELNPAFFDQVYVDLVQRPKDEPTIRRALALVTAYLTEKVDVLFGPVLDYLRDEGGIRTTTELNSYFSPQAQTENLSFAYEWLADQGIIQKVPSPVRLTPKSPVVVDEAAYYYDGPGALP
jgi:RNA polymerase sigma factor (sigma-70 family)